MPKDNSSSPPQWTGNAGFTLLELMVVVIVLGILAAIAIQNVAQYRARSIDASMRSDLRNAAMAMENYYGIYFAYPTAPAALASIGFRNSNQVTLTINLPTPATYTLTAARPSGTKPSYTFDSATGMIN